MWAFSGGTAGAAGFAFGPEALERKPPATYRFMSTKDLMTMRSTPLKPPLRGLARGRRLGVRPVLRRREMHFHAAAAHDGGRLILIVFDPHVVVGPDQTFRLVIVKGSLTDIEMQVVVALRGAVVVDDFDVVGRRVAVADQLGGDDVPAAEVPVVLAEFLVEGQERLVGADGVDLDAAAVVVVLEQGDADLREFQPAIVLDREITGGHHHVLGVQLQFQRPFQLRAVLTERLAQLVLQLEAVRRKRPDVARMVGRHVRGRQRRQAVDAAQRLA